MLFVLRMLSKRGGRSRDTISWLTGSTKEIYKRHDDVVNFYKECFSRHKENTVAGNLHPCDITAYELVRYSHHKTS